MPVFGTRGQYPGVTSNITATAGNVGEIISNSASGVALVTGTPKTVTSITLTPGEWDVVATGGPVTAATTNVTLIALMLNTVDNGANFTVTDCYITNFGSSGQVPGSSASTFETTPTKRVSVSANTVYYAVLQANFTVSTCTGSAAIRATRVH